MDNKYAVQQDTQSVSMSEFYSALMLARHVSDLIGPSTGAFYKHYSQVWHVVIRVLLDTSSRYEVVGRTAYVRTYVRYKTYKITRYKMYNIISYRMYNIKQYIT